MDGTTGAGEIYYDYINIGGITFWTSLVWADDNFLKKYHQISAEGILGTGFTLDNTLTISLIEAMFNECSLLSNIISTTLTEHSEGVLQFGAIDSSIVNKLHYTSILGRNGPVWDTVASFDGGDIFDA